MKTLSYIIDDKTGLKGLLPFKNSVPLKKALPKGYPVIFKIDFDVGDWHFDTLPPGQKKKQKKRQEQHIYSSTKHAIIRLKTINDFSSASKIVKKNWKKAGNPGNSPLLLAYNGDTRSYHACVFALNSPKTTEITLDHKKMKVLFRSMEKSYAYNNFDGLFATTFPRFLVGNPTKKDRKLKDPDATCVKSGNNIILESRFDEDCHENYLQITNIFNFKNNELRSLFLAASKNYVLAVPSINIKHAQKTKKKYAKKGGIRFHEIQWDIKSEKQFSPTPDAKHIGHPLLMNFNEFPSPETPELF